ncbi:hypothetical protein GTP46_22285 [Duganella sp. FT135W]|uniref:Uncharacterized protein n=1 Tax=Duganella flavida TaxID=2692175 RepID=A0A6L8KLB1_9BURK|nr:hypothetical protein [Duganella flavida]MYM25361.1 hypothetical protein [Duganella flavida]
MTTQTSLSHDTCTSDLDNQFRMTHTFHLHLGSSQPAAGQLESTLKESNARIDKWLILRRGGNYEHSITVGGIGEAAARTLRKALSSLNNEIKVHVEHMLHFDSAAASR